MPKITLTVETSISELAEAIASLDYDSIIKLFMKVDELAEDCELTRRLARAFSDVVAEDCSFDEEEEQE